MIKGRRRTRPNTDLLISQHIILPIKGAGQYMKLYRDIKVEALSPLVREASEHDVRTPGKPRRINKLHTLT